jgi:hypothetical protein
MTIALGVLFLVNDAESPKREQHIIQAYIAYE